MSLPRNRRQKPRRPGRQPLALEALEDRTLLSAAPPTTVLDLNGLAVNPTQYSSTDILVRFQAPPGSPGGPALVPGTALAAPLPLVSGLYEVSLTKGVSVSQALAAYKGESGVLDAEPDYDLTVSSVPNDPLLSQQWALANSGQSGGTPGADIHAEQAWNVTTGSPNVVVAVMDTGIDYDSPDLYDNIWINQAEIPNSWYTKSSATSGYDRIVYKSQIQTATPGVITFRDLNNPANAGLVWDNNGDGRIDAGDLLRPTSQGGWMNGSSQDGDTSHPDDLFGWNFVSSTNNPMDDNGHGTNVSGILGATGDNGTGVAGVDWNVQIMPVKFIGSDGNGSISDFIQGLNYAVQHGARITNNSWEGAPYSVALYSAIQNAQQHGQIFVAAAGNEGANNDTTADFPASFSSSLNNVVAVAATDNTDHLASFSNYGPHNVALAAPGVNIVSTLPGGQYGPMSGTSMAAPEVTGAMALVWGQHPTWTYTQVINQVLSTVDKLPSLTGKVSTGGRLDLAAAVGWNLSTRTTPAVTAVTPQYPSPGAMNGLVLTFNEAIDVSSFQASAVHLTNPAGGSIPVTLQLVPNSGDRQVLVQFSTQTAAGNYQLAIDGGIRDLQGNPSAAYQTTVTLVPSPTYSSGTQVSVGPSSTATSTISVPAGGSVGALQVRVNLSFPADGDLTLWLTSPKGTTILLAQHLGGSGANFSNTVFDDRAALGVSQGKAPFAGTFAPQWQLSALASQAAGGAWKLTVQNSGGHSGALLGWSLTFNAPAPSGSSPAVAPPPAPSPPPSPPPASAPSYSSGTQVSVGPSSTATSTISVPAGGSVGALQVRVNLSFPADGDLTLWLTSPKGTTILLAQHLGGSGANFSNTVFDDRAALGVSQGKAPFAGTFAPQWQLSALASQAAGGAWKLTVQNSGGHSGALLGWSLTFNAPAPTTTASVASVPKATLSPQVVPSAPAATTGTVHIASQPVGGAGQSTPAPLPGGYNDTPPPPGPADVFFSSPVSLWWLATDLLVGKRPTNTLTATATGA